MLIETGYSVQFLSRSRDTSAFVFTGNLSGLKEEDVHASLRLIDLLSKEDFVCLQMSFVVKTLEQVFSEFSEAYKLQKLFDWSSRPCFKDGATNQWYWDNVFRPLTTVILSLSNPTDNINVEGFSTYPVKRDDIKIHFFSEFGEDVTNDF